MKWKRDQVGSYEWPISPTLRERFEAKVELDPKTGCLNWTAFKSPAGYGMINNRGKMALSNRVAWVLQSAEPIPSGLQALHTCDNRACANHEHLYLGTNADNVRDKVSRGRSSFPQPSRQGEKHPFAKLNEDQVRDILARRAAGEKGRDIARVFGVSPALITRIGRRQVWRSLK